MSMAGEKPLKVHDNLVSLIGSRARKKPVCSLEQREIHGLFFLLDRSTPLFVLCSLARAADKENASVHARAYRPLSSRRREWVTHGKLERFHLERRKTRFFSGGETADFSFDQFAVSRLDALQLRVHIGCPVTDGSRVRVNVF